MFKGIDFFSDTVTRPTEAMKKAMIAAPLGDEQKGEDPTTQQLEQTVAELLGHEAAMFFPSATMANEVAIQLLCDRGDELIAAENCHLFVAEAGGPAVHAGTQAKPIATQNGIFSAADVRTAYRQFKGPLYPASKLVSVENTTNMGGGIAWSQEALNDVLTVAQELELKTHLDGARLFNAATASGLSPKQIASRFNTVTVCFSKGLGCAAGAVLAFAKTHYGKVRRLKQLMGGSMRQSGILAAACIYALEHHVERLKEDHAHAKLLAAGLSANIPHIQVLNNPPSTNMVFFEWNSPQMSPTQFLEKCIQNGLRFSQTGAKRFRAVTHLDIQTADVERALTIIKNIIRS